MNKTLAIVTFLAAALPAAAATESFTDRARVVGVHPIVERIPVTREQCWNDKVRTYEERRVTRTDTGAAIGPGTVLGAIVGGVAGHQVGSGRGNDAATAAGAVAGAALGANIARDANGRAVTTRARSVKDSVAAAAGRAAARKVTMASVWFMALSQ